VRQIELLQYVIAALDRLGISYAIVGSFGSGAWGEPRMTRDIDIVIRVSPADVARLCDAFPEDNFYVSRDAAEDAVRRHGQFNVIHPKSGNKIDFLIAAPDAWTANQISRRKAVKFDSETTGYVAAPEDIILGKLIYYREGGSEKHLRDIAGILRISDELVDRDYIDKFAVELGVADLWQAVLSRLDEGRASD